MTDLRLGALKNMDVSQTYCNYDSFRTDDWNPERWSAMEPNVFYNDPKNWAMDTGFVIDGDAGNRLQTLAEGRAAAAAVAKKAAEAKKANQFQGAEDLHADDVDGLAAASGMCGYKYPGRVKYVYDDAYYGGDPSRVYVVVRVGAVEQHVMLQNMCCEPAWCFVNC